MKDTGHFIVALLCGWACSAWDQLIGNIEFAVIRMPLAALAWTFSAGFVLGWIVT